MVIEACDPNLHIRNGLASPAATARKQTTGTHDKRARPAHEHLRRHSAESRFKRQAQRPFDRWRELPRHAPEAACSKVSGDPHEASQQAAHEGPRRTPREGRLLATRAAAARTAAAQALLAQLCRNLPVWLPSGTSSELETCALLQTTPAWGYAARTDDTLMPLAAEASAGAWASAGDWVSGGTWATAGAQASLGAWASAGDWESARILETSADFR